MQSAKHTSQPWAKPTGIPSVLTLMANPTHALLHALHTADEYVSKLALAVLASEDAVGQGVVIAASSQRPQLTLSEAVGLIPSRRRGSPEPLGQREPNVVAKSLQ